MPRIHIYDTTLRDGSQGEGVNFSLQDKLLITQKLDELGVDFIEGGYPLSNPKDAEYFQQVRTLPLKHAKVAAFGMTRKKNIRAEDDPCLKALLAAQTPVITIVGKSWDLHVNDVLGTTLEENLRMIADSVAHCKTAGREVFYDAEHFFDGFKHNPDYALQTLQGRPGRRGQRRDPLRHQRRHLARGNRRARRKGQADIAASPSASIATTIATWRSPTPSPPSPRGRPRCRGPSTASASAAATSISSASSPTSL